MRNSAIIGVLAVVIIAPIVVFAAWTALLEVGDLFNPCLTWGIGNVGVGTLNPVATGPCTISAGGTSETISQAVTMLVLIQGSILTASILGVFGIIRALPRVVSFAGIILFVESVPL